MKLFKLYLVVAFGLFVSLGGAKVFATEGYWQKLKVIEKDRLKDLALTKQRLQEISQYKESFTPDEISLYNLLLGHSKVMNSEVTAGQEVLTKLATETENDDIEARSYSILASIYRLKGENIKSFMAVDKALSLIEKVKDNRYKHNILINTVSIYKEAELTEFALEHARRLVSNANQNKNNETLCQAYHELAEIEVNANNLKLGKQRLLLAQQYCKESEQILYQFMTNAIFAGVLVQEGEYDKAEQRLIAMYSRVEDYGWELLVNLYKAGFAELYLNKGELEKALKYAESAYESLKDNSDVKRMEIVTSVLARIHTKLDNQGEAIKFYKEYMHFNMENKQRVRQRKLAFDIARRGRI